MASKGVVTKTEDGLTLATTYDHESDPSLQLSNQHVKEAKAAVEAGTDRVYRIYTDGIFDMFHIGHMQMLRQAKHALGNPDNVVLIAGCCTDEDCVKFKGKNVMSWDIRSESLKHCKWVDEVVTGPWILDAEFLEKHQIDFVAHDAVPYTSAGSEDVYAFVKAQGKFLTTQRTEGISTTDLIVQIVRDYDEHIVRNLKRGVDKKQLNLGRTWAVRAVAHQKEQTIKSQITQLKTEQQKVVASLKKLTLCLNQQNGLQTTENTSPVDETQSSSSSNNNNSSSSNSNNICQEDDTQQERQKLSVCEELSNVAIHSYHLSGAILSTSIAFLGYFNVLSYIQYYQQTNNKKD